MIKRSTALRIATLGGIGYWPKAPGTWASLVTTIVAGSLITLTESITILAPLFTIIFFTSFIAAWRISQEIPTQDPAWFVADEAVGQLIPIMVAPFNPLWWILSFILFRFFDIVKPWPISWANNQTQYTWIIWDDVLAGIAAAIVIVLMLPFNFK
ncbi:MAG: phosphatidylglycerophosphatase A [Holosporales bacterium]